MSRRRLDPMMWINPSEVRYTKATIPDRFDNKQTLASVYNQIVQQKIKVEDIPPIRVTWKGSAWWSLDNRRLYLLKQLECKKMLDLVEMKQVEVSSTDVNDFQTKEEGKYVEILTRNSNDIFAKQSSECQPKTESRPGSWLYNCFMGVISLTCFFLLRKILVEFYKALEKQSKRL